MPIRLNVRHIERLELVDVEIVVVALADDTEAHKGQNEAADEIEEARENRTHHTEHP